MKKMDFHYSSTAARNQKMGQVRTGRGGGKVKTDWQWSNSIMHCRKQRWKRIVASWEGAVGEMVSFRLETAGSFQNS